MPEKCVSKIKTKGKNMAKEKATTKKDTARKRTLDKKSDETVSLNSKDIAKKRYKKKNDIKTASPEFVPTPVIPDNCGPRKRCSYLECGRKFSEEKHLKDHVTIMHDLNWQEYITYYHRPDGPGTGPITGPGNGPRKSTCPNQLNQVFSSSSGEQNGAKLNTRVPHPSTGGHNHVKSNTRVRTVAKKTLRELRPAIPTATLDQSSHQQQNNGKIQLQNPYLLNISQLASSFSDASGGICHEQNYPQADRIKAGQESPVLHSQTSANHSQIHVLTINSSGHAGPIYNGGQSVLTSNGRNRDHTGGHLTLNRQASLSVLKDKPLSTQNSDNESICHKLPSSSAQISLGNETSQIESVTSAINEQTSQISHQNNLQPYKFRSQGEQSVRSENSKSSNKKDVICISDGSEEEVEIPDEDQISLVVSEGAPRSQENEHQPEITISHKKEKLQEHDNWSSVKIVESQSEEKVQPVDISRSDKRDNLQELRNVPSGQKVRVHSDQRRLVQSIRQKYLCLFHRMNFFSRYIGIDYPNVQINYSSVFHMKFTGFRNLKNQAKNVIDSQRSCNKEDCDNDKKCFSLHEENVKSESMEMNDDFQFECSESENLGSDLNTNGTRAKWKKTTLVSMDDKEKRRFLFYLRSVDEGCEYPCALCEFSYRASRTYIWHLFLQHCLFKCALCDNQRQNGSNIYRFIQTVTDHSQLVHNVPPEDIKQNILSVYKGQIFLSKIGHGGSGVKPKHSYIDIYYLHI